jgi:hypothetical protein
MPNWCDNTLEVTHTDPKMIERLMDAFNDARLCEEFIPSPNGEWNYDFSVNNWGTKWDVGGEEGGYAESTQTNARMSFQSAWSPPMGLYPVLESLGYTVRAMYYEPGVGFAGVYEDGQDDCYDLDGTSAEVKEQIPQELDEAFGITESMAEFEEENEE